MPFETGHSYSNRKGIRRPIVQKTPIKKPAIIKKETEHQLQCKCVRWLKTAYPNILYCSTQGGISQTANSRIQMCRAGYVNGIPDLMIYTPSGGFNGLAIEFKIGNNKPRVDQYEWRDQLINKCFWNHDFIYKFEEFTALVENYFSKMDTTEGEIINTS